MLYSVIFKGLTDEDIQTIGKRINPPILAKIGARLDAQETREAINSLAKVHIETLIIDMDSVDEALLIEAMNTYRVQRPETRIIIYARGRQPGDLALATLRGMSIHDLLAPDEPPADLAEFIIKALDSPPADYAGSARWGIKYLPAGRKLGRIVTPDIEPVKLDLVLRNIYNRNAAGRPVITIVDAGRRYEYAPTLVALRQAGVILAPSDGSLPASTVAKDQIGELYRLGHCPRFVELFLDAGKKPHSICRERLSVRFDYHEYVTATKPVAPGRKDWEAVLNRLAPGSQEMDAQSFDDEDGGGFVSSKLAQY